MLDKSSGMQKPPSPEKLEKLRANCCPPEEFVKLLKDVGSCTVESKTPTNVSSQRVESAGGSDSGTISTWTYDSNSDAPNSA